MWVYTGADHEADTCDGTTERAKVQTCETRAEILHAVRMLTFLQNSKAEHRHSGNRRCTYRGMFARIPASVIEYTVESCPTMTRLRFLEDKMRAKDIFFLTLVISKYASCIVLVSRIKRIWKSTHGCEDGNRTKEV